MMKNTIKKSKYLFLNSLIVAGALLAGTANGEIIGGEWGDPTAGDCGTGYIHVDLDGDETLEDGECWKGTVGLVEKDGKVGIGTTTPSQKLHVKDASANAVIRLDATDSSKLANVTVAGDARDITLQQYGSTASGTFAGLTAANLGIVEFGDVGIIGTSATNKFHMETNRTVRMTIDGSGNVGINDQTPSYKLEVNGTLSVGGGSNRVYECSNGTLTTNTTVCGGSYNSTSLYVDSL